VQQRPVAHEALADEHERRARRGRRLLGRGQERAHHHACLLALGLVQKAGAPTGQGRAHAFGHVAMGRQVQHHAAVAAQAKVDLGMGQRQPNDRLGHVGRLGGLGLHEFQPRRRVPEQVAHFDLRAVGHAHIAAAGFDAGFVDQAEAGRLPGRLVRRVRRDTAAMEGSASPRKPKVVRPHRSSGETIFEVACRSSARRVSSAVMPPPSSTTRISGGRRHRSPRQCGERPHRWNSRPAPSPPKPGARPPRPPRSGPRACAARREYARRRRRGCFHVRKDIPRMGSSGSTEARRAHRGHRRGHRSERMDPLVRSLLSVISATPVRRKSSALSLLPKFLPTRYSSLLCCLDASGLSRRTSEKWSAMRLRSYRPRGFGKTLATKAPRGASRRSARTSASSTRFADLA
jgi:hypothetical protein